MFKIRQATVQDIPSIIEIAEKTWWHAYSNILPEPQLRYMLDLLYAPETLREHIANGTQTFLVLLDDDRLQGFAAFGPKAGEANVSKIHKLYVLPHHHKRGYGRGLIAAIRNAVAHQGVRTLDLNVNRFNTARAFYEKLGFYILKEEDVPIGPYFMNDYVMRLEF